MKKLKLSDMKNILSFILVSSLFISCSKELGNIQIISTEKFDLNQQYEIALKRQTFEGVSLEDCVNKALSSVPNSAFLRNSTVTSKGKKVSILSDVWSLTKNKKSIKPSLANNNRDKKRNNSNYNFKVGMKVSWSHPKAGEGSGKISKIIGTQAEIISKGDSDSTKPLRLPLSILKREK